jgi:hypothetical protein
MIKNFGATISACAGFNFQLDAIDDRLCAAHYD